MTSSLPVEAIEHLLKPFLGAERANEHARCLHADMGKIGFDLRLSGTTPAGFYDHMMPQPEYVLPPNQYDVNGAKSDNQLYGSFVTSGNLLRLAQCAMIGRRFIPELWPLEFANRLLGREHLDCLNEIWWLKFWRGICSTKRGPKSLKSDPDFEWQIECKDGFAACVINLEVKRRIGTINQVFKRKPRRLSMESIAGKFGPVADDACNIVAVTVYHAVAEPAWRKALAWLDAQMNVHGILVWMEGSNRKEPLRKCIKDSRRWAEFLLLPPEEEDLMVCGVPFGTTGSDPIEEIERITDPPRIII